MKNRIAWKLTLYFAAVLLLFALGTGLTFSHFFREHTLAVKRGEIQVHAAKIAEFLSENPAFSQGRHGDFLANGRLIRFLSRVGTEHVWVLDAQRNLRMHMPEPPPGEKRHRRHRMEALEQNPREAYLALPPEVRSRIDGVFQGREFTLEEFNPVLEEIVITAGAPVYVGDGSVQAAVLLHAPVRGMREAAWGGIRIMLASCLLALALAIGLRVLFSWRFPIPLKIMREIAGRLAEKDYQARCRIASEDEIGELAGTLDILAERLRLADEESRKLEQLRREFIANISHELRTPVTVIRGSLEALRDGVAAGAGQVREYYGQMLRESVFLERLINDLLDLSRLQNNDFPIQKEKFNLCDVLQDAVRSARGLGREKGISVALEMDAQAYAMYGDYGRIRQMLLIFLQNSVKFSGQGSVIEVQLCADRLTVLDHGCGMAKEELEHAFERFYKARNENNKSGSGLGLAIAREIALRHGMRLKLESEQHCYTRVSVLLPPTADGNETAGDKSVREEET